MTVREELALVRPTSSTAVTIGTFDGVHLGHRHLLKRLKEAAIREGLASLVVTFRNHPRNVLDSTSRSQYITDVDTRVALLKELGADQVVCINFTRELSLLSAREFVLILMEKLQMKGLVMGPDFALGHGREGDAPAMRRLGEQLGFWLETVDPFRLEEGAVKSRAIRELLVQGRVEEAGRMLGRYFSVSGTVVLGERRGRQLGFPTANISPPADMVLPGDGIYATWATVEGKRYESATSIGVRPTFGAGERLVEGFLMDFEGDIYDKELTLEFVRRLRDELAFPTVEALVEQMVQDVEQSRAVLSGRADA